MLLLGEGREGIDYCREEWGVRRWVSDTHRLCCVLCLVLETLDSAGSAISLLVCMELENATPSNLVGPQVWLSFSYTQAHS